MCVCVFVCISGSDLVFCGMFGTAAHRKHTHTYAHVKVESSSRVSRLGSKGAQVESEGMKRWRALWRRRSGAGSLKVRESKQ